eukprot:gnl/MRDRNA2_/MRDRNA2_224780_c0_seq1.p1 gnl/MRDRNA2_/MRDRNA2_224780_c0~~gnl/MRDRNA2_/MRDRNA2_224780_c0_seq1.p1  ORF type:complete len:522 (-),score=52.62 gnl/MRDRNA2_/MRDRNA2_224780_c0_seq1:40-1575(-)
MSFSLSRLAPAGIYLHDAGEHTGSTSSVFLAAGLVNLVGSLLLLCVWGVQYRRFVNSQGTQGLAPTLGAYLALHGCAGIAGLSSVIVGAVLGWHFYVMGVCLMIVPCVVLLVGRDRFFHLMASQFDKDADRIMREGAFVATLLDHCELHLNQAWWVHRTAEEGKDLQYPASDPRHNWNLGRIVEINDNEFTVALYGRGAASDAGPAFRESISADSARKRVAKRLLAGRFFSDESAKGPPGRMERLVAGRNFSSDSAKGPMVRKEISSDSGNSRELIRLPMAKRMISGDELLPMAKKNLRCIEWRNITKELMAGAVCGADSLAGLYDLSRPVLDGEVIDFFMSHSWHDNADLKRRHLVRIAEDFHACHGRFPTYWLDKVCIDQNRIADGLRMLPINIIACAKMLVLCGETYPRRLWCAWELCTLFSLMPDKLAAQRIKFVLLQDEQNPLPSESLERKVASFDYRNACCYDPNEERKLHSIIATLGAEFNQRIRSLFLQSVSRTRKSYLMDTE